MICAGIPVLRPLYKRWLPSTLTGSSNNKYRKSSHTEDGRGFALRTIGGGTMGGDREGVNGSSAGMSGNRTPRRIFVLRRTSDSDDEVLNPVPRRGSSTALGAGCGMSLPVNAEAQARAHEGGAMHDGVRYAV